MGLFQTVKTAIETVVNIPTQIQIKSEHSKTVLLLSPQYLNYGDHLIARSELDFFGKKLKKPSLDINYTFFDLWDSKACRAVGKDDILWITGGGYIGDLWPESHNMVEKVIKRFPDNTIVFAPQTAFFTDKGSKTSDGFVRLVTSHGKCIFFSRDKKTHDTLNSIGIESQLAPDFGLLYRPDYNKLPIKNKYVALCLRNDTEKVITDCDIEEIRNALKSENLPLHNILMAKEHCEIPTWTRTFFVRKKLEEYSAAKVVVTDRLHGMVFSAIAGVPCVALDNKSRKVSGLYEQWIGSLDYVKVAASPDQIQPALKEVMKFSDKTANRKQYDALASDLLNEYGSVFDRYIK